MVKPSKCVISQFQTIYSNQNPTFITDIQLVPNTTCIEVNDLYLNTLFKCSKNFVGKCVNISHMAQSVKIINHYRKNNMQTLISRFRNKQLKKKTCKS